MMSLEKNIELVRFRPVECVVPVDQPPSKLPDCDDEYLFSGTKRPWKKIAAAISKDEVQREAGKTSEILDTTQHNVYMARIENYLARRLYLGGYSVEAMKAQSESRFAECIDRLTVAAAYYPKATPRNVAKNRLDDAHHKSGFVIQAEAGLVAVGAFFSYQNPEFATSAALTVYDGLKRVSDMRGNNSEPPVSPDLTIARGFTGVLKEPGSQYIEYASQLSQQLEQSC